MNKVTPHEAFKLKYEIDSLKEAIEFVQNGYKPEAVDENGKPYSPYFLLGYLEGASKRVVRTAQTVFEK
jgi:hypothetical protein